MKLSYKASGSQNTWSVLADESDRVTTLELAEPSWQRQVQVESLVRAESVSRFDRGNVAVQLPVVATITYASQAAALASLATFATLFVAPNDLKLEHTSGQTATVLFFTGCVCSGYKPAITGVTVRHALQFITGQVTTQEA